MNAGNIFKALQFLPIDGCILKKIAKAGCVYEEFISYEINRKTGG